MRNNKEEFDISKDKINMSAMKDLRLKMGYSVIKLQHLVGVTDTSLNAYEQGKRIPSLPVAYRLADVLNTSIDNLCGRDTRLNAFYLLSDTDKEKVLKLIDELLKISK